MPTASPNSAAVRPSLARRLARAAFVAAVAVGVAALTLWGALYLWCSTLPSDYLRGGLAIGLVLGTVAAFALCKQRGRTLLAFACVMAVLIGWFFLRQPTGAGPWQREVAVLPSATIDGDLVTIRNVRNFEYRTDTDFTPRYEDRTYDLNKLESVDLICVYWGSPAIAHVMGSFGFGGSNFVTFSIEMRAREGEQTSMLKSFFRNYELICVVADERDIVRLRTDFRNPQEEVHIYRVRLPLENQRKLFLSYIELVQELDRTPRWYNALVHNCTTGVMERTHAYKGRGHYNWKVLLSGYVPEYSYEIGMLDTSMPYPELQQRCLINDRAHEVGDAPDFSALIREGLPAPKPYTLEEFLTSP